MIMEATPRDKIERCEVIQEPIPPILAIGQSIIVATQVRLRSGSSYQGVHAPKARRLRLLKRNNECQSTGWTVALISLPTQVSEFGQEETSLAFVGSAATSWPDRSLSRSLNALYSTLLF